MTTTRRRARWEIRDAEDGQVYVVLVAANGEVLSTSETFPDERAARRNIDAQKRAVLITMAARVRRR